MLLWMLVRIGPSVLKLKDIVIRDWKVRLLGGLKIRA